MPPSALGSDIESGVVRDEVLRVHMMDQSERPHIKAQLPIWNLDGFTSLNLRKLLTDHIHKLDRASCLPPPSQVHIRSTAVQRQLDVDHCPANPPPSPIMDNGRILAVLGQRVWRSCTEKKNLEGFYVSAEHFGPCKITAYGDVACGGPSVPPLAAQKCM